MTKADDDESALDIVRRLEEEVRMARTQYAGCERSVSDLRLEVAALTAKLEGRASVVNCPKCGRKYKGAAPAGKRQCSWGCGGGAF